MADGFSDAERQALLALKGVGPTVIARLEELGLTSFERLATASVEEICAKIAATLGATCWRNSPMARAAIAAAVARAGQASLERDSRSEHC